MSAKYDIDAIEKRAKFLAPNHAVHLNAAELLAMCADIRRYEKALSSEDIRCEDSLQSVRCHSSYCRGRGMQACEAAERALAGDSDEQG